MLTYRMSSLSYRWAMLNLAKSGNAAMPIPSQPMQECSGGVTTRSWSPERTVKAHECGSVNDAIDSLSCAETNAQKHGIKSLRDNITDYDPKSKWRDSRQRLIKWTLKNRVKTVNAEMPMPCQAVQGCAEGVTTRGILLEQLCSPHERPTLVKSKRGIPNDYDLRFSLLGKRKGIHRLHHTEIITTFSI